MAKPGSAILYLTYDGLTDPLGQSQVLPYLERLAAEGYRVTVVSFEKPAARGAEPAVRQRLAAAGIGWIPRRYTKRPPVISTVLDILEMRRVARRAARRLDAVAAHCRSYLPAMVGHHLRRAMGLALVFDMRGFWADERVDGGIWDLRNPVYRAVYGYMKRWERRLLRRADRVVCLTRATLAAIAGRVDPAFDAAKAAVIPCCADLRHFAPQPDAAAARAEWRAALGIGPGDYVLAYLGSLGTWYLADQMLDFFAELQRGFRPDAIFLAITLGDPGELLSRCRARGVDPSRVRARGAQRAELPRMLAAVDAAVSFIAPKPSKEASSPTKLAELLGCGVPVFSNAGVGDVADYYRELPELLVASLDAEGYRRAISAAMAAGGTLPARCVAAARRNFSLDDGARGYLSIYQSLPDTRLR